MKIATVKRKYKNMWVLAEVLEENELNQPVDVQPIIASKDRDKIYDRIASVPRGKTIATLYTGKITGTYILLHGKR